MTGMNEAQRDAHNNVVRAMVAHLHVRLKSNSKLVELGEKNLGGVWYTEVFVNRIPIWRVESWTTKRGDWEMRSYPVCDDWSPL